MASLGRIHPRRGTRFPNGALAFSLVEVVLALGIATFALVAIVGLLPAGLRSSKESMEESRALNILSALVADRQAAPLASPTALYHLPALTPDMTAVTNVFGIAGTSQYLAQPAAARFRVTCWFTPPAAGTLNPYLAYFQVSWPAGDAHPSSRVEIIATFPQP